MQLLALAALLVSLTAIPLADASGEGAILYTASNGLLFAVRPDVGVRRLLLRRSTDRPEFAVSPDGRWVVYVALPSPPGPYDLYVRRLSGGGHRRLTDDARQEFGPDWSPDGRRLVYAAFGGLDGLFVLEVAGGREPVRISRAGGIYEAPSWSPDGRTILFAWRRCLTCVSTVRTVNADGTGERVLAGARRTTYSAAPRWSPLGTRIVDSWEGRVWTMGRDGSNRRRLTRGADVDWGPVWSPDGRRIAFLRSRPRQAVVSVVNADGSGLRSLDRTRGYSVAGSGRVVAWLP